MRRVLWGGGGCAGHADCGAEASTPRGRCEAGVYVCGQQYTGPLCKVRLYCTVVLVTTAVSLTVMSLWCTPLVVR